MKYSIAAGIGALTALSAAAVLAQPPATAPAPAAAGAAPARAGRAAPAPATGEITQIPKNLAPPRIQSAALNVTDLPGMQKWYETVFGMVKIRDVSASEIVLSLDPANPNAVALVLQRSATKAPGNTNYGRLILNVRNAKDTADFLQTHGVTVRAVIPNQAYFLSDPEGNQVELYQPDYVAPARGGAAQAPARGG